MSNIIAREHILELIAELKGYSDLEKKLKKQKERAVQKLHDFMMESETLVTTDGEVIATWKYANDSVSFDAKKFQTENAELHEKYMAVKPGTRRLLIK